MNGLHFAGLVATVTLVVWGAVRIDGWLTGRRARNGMSVSEATRARLAAMREAEEDRL